MVAQTNTALSYAVMILAIGLIGMCVYTLWRAQQIVTDKPIVVRVEKVGRAEAVNLEWEEYRPEDSDMKYFLTQFVTGFFSRNRATVQDVYPASLHYLREDLFRIVNQNDRQSKWLAKFVTSNDPETSINITNVALDRAMEASGNYRGVVDAIKTTLLPGGVDQKSIPIVVTCWFQSHPEVIKKDPELIKYNPLGFLIYNVRCDDAFSQVKP